ncbi:MAG: PilN domain-containing protein [Acidobacteriaceae bacterium]
MRVTVNLATKPFVELRPLYARLRIAIGALLVLMVVLATVLRVVDKRAQAAQVQMDALVNQTHGFQQERLGNEARMREPQNARLLEQSHFLNALFARKGFSWTAVMMDLEQVLPGGVQVTSIEPQITPDHDIVIRLRVSGERDKAVQLVKNLESSRSFVHPRLASESAENQDTNQQRGVRPVGLNSVQFDILSDYNPLPVKPKEQTSKGKDEKAPPAKKPIETELPAKRSPANPSVRGPR